MKKYLEVLKMSDFFKHLDDTAILTLTSSDTVRLKQYPAGTVIYECGQPILYAGIVLEGEIDVLHTTEDGYETLVNRLLPSHTFGESFCCVSDINTINTIRSVTQVTVLFLDLSLLLHTLQGHEAYYTVFTRNVIRSLANNNIQLNSKVYVLTKKTLREKILTYFELLSAQTHTREIELPFNREQLANYLGSERSSLCRELSRLAEEQVIRINKNKVILPD